MFYLVKADDEGVYQQLDVNEEFTVITSDEFFDTIKEDYPIDTFIAAILTEEEMLYLNSIVDVQGFELC